MVAQRTRIRLTMAGVALLALGLGAWPVSIAMRKEVRLIDSDKELRPGMGSRGAFMNTGSKDMGPDTTNPMKKSHAHQ